MNNDSEKRSVLPEPARVDIRPAVPQKVTKPKKRQKLFNTAKLSGIGLLLIVAVAAGFGGGYLGSRANTISGNSPISTEAKQ